MLKKSLLLFFLAAVCGQLAAQSLWTDLSGQTVPTAGERRIVPNQYRTVRLDLDAAESLLAAAPERFKPEAADNQTLLTLPTPDGGWQTFRLYESPVMAPALQTQYPDIRCYTGVGIEDPTATLKCDLTPWGFHAMVRSATQGAMFIDPYSHGDREHYIVYFKKDYQSKKNAEFTCGVEDGELDLHAPADASSPDFQGDCQLRQYRLALACTGEYAAFHGGTVPLALAAMNTTMNRVNGVYETDLAITMQIIPNNNLIVYLNAATDPYTNGNGSTMLGQNVANCNAVIGVANYDIGHVFSTGGGGIAGLQVVCTNNKARGVTGGSSPVGDPFDIDYVAHEMGHQFGANHTQNNNCNRVAGASMEPGSASTIMGYAGICNPNVQNNSDDYFHAISLQEISNFITNPSHTCPVEINTGNNAPTVSAGADYTIPRSTPFALTAVGNDPDNDSLTYCWEQMDPEFATMPPVSTSATGPLFRSYKGVASPTRWFPRLPDLVTNTNSQWEELPGVNRTMKFRVTARDNFAGAGCTEEDDVVLTVAASTGPFVVSAPNTNVLWYVGQTQTVTWNVASTDLAPVNCANVRILLSTDGGFTYPTVLLNSTANDGTADVIVPNNVSNTCRVMVQSVGNVFFDISNVNFRIQLPPVPTFVLTTTPDALEACAGNTGNFSINLEALAGFDQPVQISLSGAPAGATVDITPNPLTPTGSAAVTLGNLTPAMAGDYTLTVEATGDTITKTATVQLSLLPGPPTDFPELALPADGETGVALVTTLEWDIVPFATTYSVEVATSPSFTPGSLAFSGTTAGTTIDVSGLLGNTVYYWRVKAENSCGMGVFSPAAAFQTANLDCSFSFNSTDVPVNLDPASVNTVSSSLDIPIDASIIDVDVHLEVDHTWVGDLLAELTSPLGTTVQLFDQPGVPASQFGCSSDNVDVTLDDEAALTATDLENACGVNPAISGAYQGLEALSAFDGESTLGEWVLSVSDNFAEDGGALTAWSLHFCLGGPNETADLITNAPLTLIAGAEEIIDNGHLEAELTGTAAEGLFTVLVLPEFGQLLLDGTPLGIGGTFTQADIDAGLLSYQHDGSAGDADLFHFDFVDQNNGGWLHGGIFNLIILQNSLVVSAAQTQGLACHDETTGAITVTANGGTPPLTYSLNGGPAQDDNEFTGLAAGAYTAVITDANGFMATTDTVTINNPAAITADASVDVDDVTVTASGGTGALEYSLDGQNFQPGNVFENLANGVYTITVQDENGCTATVQATVAVNTLVVALDVQATIACADGADGALVVTVGGGTPPLTYSLNGGAPQSSGVFANLPAGDYSVVVTDDEGFTATTNTVTLDNPAALDVSASTTDDDVTVTATGGTGALEYSLDGQNFQSSNVFADLPNGIYTVTVQDTNGCTATTTAIVAVNTLLALLDIQAEIACNGGNEGTLSVNVGGGEMPYEYSLNGGPYQPENVFSGLPAGDYTVTVRDNVGFTATTNTVTLSAPTAISASAGVSLNTITVTASGGTGALEYSLDGQNFQSDPVFTGLANGDYTVTVRDENGCTATASATVAVGALVFADLDVTPILCNGGTATVTVDVGGGIPPYEYSLNNGAWQSSNVLENVPGGPNLISVRDAAGTIISTSGFEVAEPDPLAVTLEVTYNDVTDIDMTGGTPPYSITTDADPDLMDLPNGTYGLTVTDANGCTTSTEFTIDVAPLAFLDITITGLLCAGATDGILTVTATGGIPPYEYSLDGSPWQSSNVFSGLSADVYNVRVRDAEGTIIEINVAVNQPAPLAISLTILGNDVYPDITGGTPPYTWSIPGQPDLIDLPNGTYTLTATDANGCTTTATFEINYTALSGSLNFLGDPCTSDDVQIFGAGGVPPYEYAVNNGPFQTSGVFNNLAPGVYTFTVQDAAGDEYDLPVVVVSAPLTATAAQIDIATVLISTTGGSGFFVYTLGDSTQSTPTFVNMPEGIYTATVTDLVTGCVVTIEEVLVIYPATIEPAEAWGLVVSPNPGRGLFQLTMQNAPAATFRADVFDAAGRLMQSNTFAAGSGSFATTLDLLDRPAGMYFLRLTDGVNVGAVRLSVIR